MACEKYTNCNNCVNENNCKYDYRGDGSCWCNDFRCTEKECKRKECISYEEQLNEVMKL